MQKLSMRAMTARSIAQGVNKKSLKELFAAINLIIDTCKQGAYCGQLNTDEYLPKDIQTVHG